MSLQRRFRTFRRRYIHFKSTFGFFIMVVIVTWRRRSSSSEGDVGVVDRHHEDYDEYAYERKGMLYHGYDGGLANENRLGEVHEPKANFVKDYQNLLENRENIAKMFKEKDGQIHAFKKLKRQFGIGLEEDEDFDKGNRFRIRDAFKSDETRKAALSKLKQILGLPPDEVGADRGVDEAMHGNVGHQHEGLNQNDNNDKKENNDNADHKQKVAMSKVKKKPLDFEIGEIGRPLPDVRPVECKHKSYPENLPTASVIIIFYDEGLKTLLRTVHSIVNRSPPHLISEIILLDDFSTKEHYTKELKVQLNQVDYPIVIRRTNQRFGWVLARIQGAEYAHGDVLIFLDAHTEVTEGWLEPILGRISGNRQHLVFPVIDHIEPKTLKYMSDSEYSLKVGVFDWSFGVTWQHFPTHGHDPTSPISSPVMADAVFAIDREYFIKLDGYDPFYSTEDIADLDLSFKVWMCGGFIELLPCSHVGHLHRPTMPFRLPGRGEINDRKRLAELWLGEYTNFFYTIFPNAKTEKTGDLTDEEALIKKLKCKSISWYWETVYSNSIWPINGERYGEIHHIDTKQCLDIAVEEIDHQVRNAVTSVVVCDGAGTSQMWMLTSIGEIRNNFLCLESLDGMTVTASKCHRQKSNQEWMIQSSIERIYHAVSQHCLDFGSDGRVTLQPCNPSPSQSWKLVPRAS
ncbi:Polypeptide N-acetylgalactosaminyltransferase 1 [Holothuria leucospilota]|uniref:Polypeptide N-acetylgalactosaminyltransferase n=1 Tax=Holothuria leucospilota TaxID=206669 RepID=A0A9Q0YLM2_HOLLE|nr:Polypeptide N-acetylgalactosaminyltransferase 1 [Holothuria leucospilota]